MRHCRPNILIDGARVRTSLDNQPLATAANTAANVEAYEVRPQDVLRQNVGNPAGAILLDDFASLWRRYEMLSPRSERFDLHLDVSNLPLGWTPLDEYENY